MKLISPNKSITLYFCHLTFVKYSTILHEDKKNENSAGLALDTASEAYQE